MPMSLIFTGPPVVQELKFFPDYVKVIFQDNQVEDFYGPENLRVAKIAVAKSKSATAPGADLQLTDQKDNAVIMIVPKGAQAFQA